MLFGDYQGSISGGRASYASSRLLKQYVRDWSLITGRGGLQNGRGGGGHMKFYPYKKKGGGGERFSHAGGGAQKVKG